ncbi:hypothetical protein PAAG_06059 [Paracoccidioides lutzii Pb01]|uniref:Uncharacterized protein n=1 Tax=Paracoccidioides lutzii (strain ATCC MYA-826 / Pb01) TaxID=502779 RepID=C1H5U9_PARBA|nr:hypothetical protein PAAG_06059 [Paracoccidioides lutzii Pb01]EEH35012.2 hypothetical protein PAAG_06059 [Paracoccidioides lutzii Pb01]
MLVTNLCAIHAKRVTIQERDMKLVQRLRQIMTGSRIPGRGNDKSSYKSLLAAVESLGPDPERVTSK